MFHSRIFMTWRHIVFDIMINERLYVVIRNVSVVMMMLSLSKCFLLIIFLNFFVIFFIVFLAIFLVSLFFRLFHWVGILPAVGLVRNFISDSFLEWWKGAHHESVNLCVHFPFGNVSVVLPVFSLSEEA